jgi:hypothetical protein
VRKPRLEGEGEWGSAQYVVADPARVGREDTSK